MTGTLRSEWHLSYTGLATPCNWSAGYSIQPLEHYSPIDFLVADARNIVADRAIKENYKWLLFIDHDVCLPYNTLQLLNEYMREGAIPIVGGLYFTRGIPSEPLMYRGLGNSFYSKWKIGDKVWLTGMGLGCNLIHVSLLKSLAEDCEEYKVNKGLRVKRIFETPCDVFIDPETRDSILQGPEKLTQIIIDKLDKLSEEKFVPCCVPAVWALDAGERFERVSAEHILAVFSVAAAD